MQSPFYPHINRAKLSVGGRLCYWFRDDCVGGEDASALRFCLNLRYHLCVWVWPYLMSHISHQNMVAASSYIAQHGASPSLFYTWFTVHICTAMSLCRVGSDDFLVIHTRDDFAALHGTTPYTHSSPGTPINMPWLGGVQTGRGASVVSSAPIFVCCDIGLAICFPRTSSSGLFSTSLVPCEFHFSAIKIADTSKDLISGFPKQTTL